ncbi:MAG: hypothetical protein K2N29_00190 [Ruminiclostridium sp.]|nr:hypothetical protein [Ruminiclostridium sp.]
MKKITSIFLSLALLLSVGGCNAEAPAPEQNEQSEQNEQNKQNEQNEEVETVRTNPGEFLLERDLTLAIGDKEFSLTDSYEEVKALFGDDLVFLPDKEEEIKQGDTLSGSLYCDEKYFGLLSFSFDDLYGSGRFYAAIMEFPFEEEPYTSAFRRAENGSVSSEDVLLEPEALTVRFGDFTTGISTRSELRESFGSGLER